MIIKLTLLVIFLASKKINIINQKIIIYDLKSHGWSAYKYLSVSELLNLGFRILYLHTYLRAVKQWMIELCANTVMGKLIEHTNWKMKFNIKEAITVIHQNNDHCRKLIWNKWTMLDNCVDLLHPQNYAHRARCAARTNNFKFQNDFICRVFYFFVTSHGNYFACSYGWLLCACCWILLLSSLR